MAKFAPPRGTRDFSPEEMTARRAVEATLRGVMERFGYREVQTPTFENLEIFTTKSGEAVKKQLYVFKDKSDRELTLRPELTAPVLRYYVSDHQNTPKPIKWFYFGPCFRYEEPQSGRYREFWQLGCELIGPTTPEAVAEVIALGDACFDAVGLDNLELRVGHVGIVKGLVASLGLGEQARAEVMRLVDKKDRTLEAALTKANAPPPAAKALVALTFHGDRASREPATQSVLDKVPGVAPALQDLADVVAILPSLGVTDAVVDPAVVRGLDYYTGVVFEFHSPDLGAESQVCGGGAYALAELFGGKPVGSIGFGLGFDRAVLALEKRGRLPPATAAVRVFLVAIGDGARREALALASELRRAGVSCDVDLMRRSPSKAFDYANAIGARNVIVIGEKELARGVVALKDMETAEQRDVKRAELLKLFQGHHA